MDNKRLPVPIGIADYKELIDEQCIYIDKTLLIKEFWEEKSKVVLVARPRRFGKTINLSMLKYFFERTEKSNAYLFEQSLIWKEECFREFQGQFPVIFISFKDVKEDSWEEAYEQITELLVEEIDRVITPISLLLTPHQKKQYEALINQTASKVKFCNSLRFITKVLEKHYNKKVIILIDEYDTPITNAYIHKYYKKMIGFMRNLLSAALKDNDSLHRAFLTGVVRTAKDGALSGLNSLDVCTVLSNIFSDKFGFIQEEVDLLLAKGGLLEKKEEVKSWYNGYKIGEKSIYNPWSILNYIREGIFQTYWVNTSNNDLLERLVAEADEETQKELKLLLEGNPVEKKQIDEGVILLDLDSKQQEPWSFLLFAGYLTSLNRVFVNNKYYHSLTVPNAEVAVLYEELVLKAINKALSSIKLDTLLNALLSGKVSIVKDLLSEFIGNMCSFYDLQKNDLEKSLHLFVLGLLVSLSNRYIIKSNLESGEGRYDIMLFPKTANDPGILIEFKRAQKNDLEKTSLDALQQIKDKNYQSLLREFGYKGDIFCYGISAFKKHLSIQMDILT